MATLRQIIIIVDSKRQSCEYIRIGWNRTDNAYILMTILVKCWGCANEHLMWKYSVNYRSIEKFTVNVLIS